MRDYIQLGITLVSPHCFGVLSNFLLHSNQSTNQRLSTYPHVYRVWFPLTYQCLQFQVSPISFSRYVCASSHVQYSRSQVRYTNTFGRWRHLIQNGPLVRQTVAVVVSWQNHSTEHRNKTYTCKFACIWYAHLSMVLLSSCASAVDVFSSTVASLSKACILCLWLGCT